MIVRRLREIGFKTSPATDTRPNHIPQQPSVLLLSSADTSLTMRLPPRVQKPHLPSMARAALHQAVAVALTSASLLGAPTNLPALAATPPAPAIEQPAKTWGVGNELKIPDPRQNGGRISDTASMLRGMSHRPKRCRWWV